MNIKCAKILSLCLLVSCSDVITRAAQWRVDTSLPQPEFKKTTLPLRTLNDGKGGVFVWGFNNLIHNANGQRSGVVIKLNATNGLHDNSFELGTSLMGVLAGQADSEGRLYVSASAPGDATDEGNNYRIFRILKNGTIDASYASPPFNVSPRWFRLLGDGKLIVSQPGRSNLGRTTVDKTVRLNSDGSLDEPFSSNTPSLDWADSFASPIVDKQGRVLLGGLVGGVTRPLARLLPTGKIDTSFVPSGFSILSGSVRGIGLQSNGKIIVAGRFSTPKTGSTNYGIVCLNDNGSLDTTFTLVTTTAAGFANASNPFGRVRLLEIVADDKMIAIGDRGLRRFNSDGSIDHSYPGLNFNSDHFWMEVLPDGGVFVPSDFAGGNRVGTNTVVGIIKLKPDGHLDPAFRPPTFQEEVFPHALGVQADGNLIVAGGGLSGFDSVSGVSTVGVAKFNSKLALNTEYKPFASLSDFRGISSQVMAPDGTLFVNVNLGLDDFNNADHLFKVSASGVKDPLFDLPGDDISELNWVDGLLVGRGNSAQAIIDRAPLVQRYTSAGDVDSAYVGIGSADSISQVILKSGLTGKPPFNVDDVGVIKSGSFSIGLVLPDGRSYASICNSTNYGQHRIIRLKVDGSHDPTFAPVVFDIKSNPWIDYPVISQGANVLQIETWNPQDAPFTSGTVLTNGELVVCGYFTQVQGFATPGVVKIHPDGSIDKTFKIGTGASYSNQPGLSAAIHKIVQLQTGQLLVLGQFDHFNSTVANGLVILDSDGSVSLETPSDITLPSNAFQNTRVDAYSISNDRVLLVGPFVQKNSVWPTAITELVRSTDDLQPMIKLGWVNNSTLQITWRSSTGLTYIVKESSDLNSWTIYSNPISGNGTESTVDIPVESGQSRFFRVIKQ